jgi:hypothetical protein
MRRTNYGHSEETEEIHELMAKKDKTELEEMALRQYEANMSGIKYPFIGLFIGLILIAISIPVGLYGGLGDSGYWLIIVTMVIFLLLILIPIFVVRAFNAKKFDNALSKWYNYGSVENMNNKQVRDDIKDAKHWSIRDIIKSVLEVVLGFGVLCLGLCINSETFSFIVVIVGACIMCTPWIIARDKRVEQRRIISGFYDSDKQLMCEKCRTVNTVKMNCKDTKYYCPTCGQEIFVPRYIRFPDRVGGIRS